MIYVTMGVGLGGATDDMSGVMDIVDDIAMQTPYLGVGAISPLRQSGRSGAADGGSQ